MKVVINMVFLDDFIESFWTELGRCKHTNDYIRLLEKAELTAAELLHTLEGEAFKSFYEESPLLAMTSEVEMRCPEAVQILAEENVVFSSALFILDDYTRADRLALRRDFLKRELYNVLNVDFTQKKKGD